MFIPLEISFLDKYLHLFNVAALIPRNGSAARNGRREDAHSARAMVLASADVAGLRQGVGRVDAEIIQHLAIWIASARHLRLRCLD